MASDDPLATFIAQLKSPDSSARADAAIFLGKLGDESLVEPLLDVLDDESDYVRDCVVTALGELGSVRALPALLDLLGHKNPHLRTGAAQAIDTIYKHAPEASLAALKDAQPVPRLIDATRDPSPLVVDVAVFLLGELQAEEAVNTLCGLLQHEAPMVRADAAAALGQLKATQAVPGLIKLLDDEHEQIRQCALEALAEIGDPSCLPRIKQVADSDQSPAIRHAARTVLKQLKSGRGGSGLFGKLRGAFQQKK